MIKNPNLTQYLYDELKCIKSDSERENKFEILDNFNFILFLIIIGCIGFVLYNRFNGFKKRKKKEYIY